jgi:hypothetical protein
VCNENKSALVISIKVIASLLIALSIAEFGVGGATYSYFTNIKLGSWWGAWLPFIAGVLGVITKPKGLLVGSIFTCIFGVFIAITAAGVDGIAALIFKTEQACISQHDVPSNEDYFNSMSGINSVGQIPARNVCIEQSIYSPFTFDCLCGPVIAPGGPCLPYDGHLDCASILTEYPQLLLASSALNGSLAILCFVFAIISCVYVFVEPADHPAGDASPRVSYSPMLELPHVDNSQSSEKGV